MSQKNCWFWFNASGEILGSGEGAMPEPPEGVTVRFRDNPAALAAEPVLQDILARQAARGDIHKANKGRDAQVYVAKEAEFRAYMLAHAADEGVIEADDPAVIDELLYPYMYDEYWNTFDVSALTPWDLARAGIANADKVATESNRRRDKLIALAVLDAAQPEIPEL